MLTSAPSRMGLRGTFAALGFALLTLAPALHAAPHAANGSVRVTITTVEMPRADVGRLAVETPPETARRDALRALEHAARRAHVPFAAVRGATVTATTGHPVTDGDVTVTPLSVRAGRAFVRIRVLRRATVGRGRPLVHVIADSHLYRSGATRLLAGVRLPRDLYRYTFATVTVLPMSKG